MTVQNFMKIVWTVFEKFEIFMKMSGEKKRHDCISSRKFFPTPKNAKWRANSVPLLGFLGTLNSLNVSCLGTVNVSKFLDVVLKIRQTLVEKSQ